MSHPRRSRLLGRIFAATVLFFILKALIGCATLPPDVSESCLEFEPPVRVTCYTGGVPLVAGPTAILCHRPNPDRWTLTGDQGSSITVVGGECVALVDGLR